MALSLHRPRIRMLLLAMSIIAAVSGCATYRPLPLADDKALVRPAIEDIARQAPVDHPRLPPSPVLLDRPLAELDVARLALVANPDLIAQRRQAGVAEAQLFAAGLLPDPQLSLSLDRPYESGLVNGFAGGLSFDLTSLLTRSADVAGGRHNLERVRSDVAWSEWLLINQVRTLCRRIRFLEQQTTIAEEAAGVAKQIYDLSAKNKRRGDAKLDETTLYQIGFLDAQDRMLGLRRSLTAAKMQLNALVGLAPEATLTLADAPVLKPVGEFTATQLTATALHQRFDLVALREGYATQEASVRKAVRASIPLPQLGINRARDTSAVWSRGPSLGIGIPLWNRGRGDIRISEATRAQLADEYAARIIQTQADIAALRADLTAIDAQRAALAAEIPELTRAADVLDKAARAGDVSLVTYETVRAALLDKKLGLSALEQAQSEGEIALESAVGDRIWPAP